MNDYPYHRERSARVGADAQTLFKRLDDPWLLGQHMNQRSLMMAGAAMRTETDAQRGQAIGSVIRMSGRFLGLTLWLEETVIERMAPHRKVWETRGTPRLLVIGHYRMGFELRADPPATLVRLWIDYSLPAGPVWRALGRWLAPVYADWCLRRMLQQVAPADTAEAR